MHDHYMHVMRKGVSIFLINMYATQHQLGYFLVYIPVYYITVY